MRRMPPWRWETERERETKWERERRQFGNENASQMNSGVMNVPGSIPR